ncbi:hypothetical protein F5Y02DRAFT_181301 [Annulohypoxylon stygium]|nr:hypothetical protein F5Y02DRAFT_181301 [Annulohypoxylon stygium]
MGLSQNNDSTTERSSLHPTGHEMPRHDTKPIGILVKSPKVYTRHIHWANQLQTRQTASIVGAESLRPLAVSTPDRLQPGRSSEHKHTTSSSRIPSLYHMSADHPSPDNNPARATEQRIQFGSLPSPDQDRQRRRSLRRRSPSPYPDRGSTQSDKDESKSHARSTQEKNVRKGFWQQCLDFETSFLTILATAYDTKLTEGTESNAYEKEDGLDESGLS